MTTSVIDKGLRNFINPISHHLYEILMYHCGHARHWGNHHYYKAFYRRLNMCNLHKSFIC